MPTATAMLMMFILSAPLTHADDAGALYEQIESYLAPSTLVIVQVDLRAVDVPSVAEQVRAGIQAIDADAELRQAMLAALLPEAMVEAVDQWVSQMRDGGAGRVFALVDMEDTFAGRGIFLLVVPLDEGADARAIRGLLMSGRADGPVEPPAERHSSTFLRHMTTAMLDEAVVFGPPSAIERVSARPGQPNPGVREAFAVAAARDVQLLFVPSPDAQRVLADFAPELLPPAPDALRRGLRWLALGVDLPPVMSLDVVVQSADEHAAEALHEAITGGVAALPAMIEREGPPLFDLLDGDALAAVLQPRREADRLHVELDHDEVEQLLFAGYLPALYVARHEATATQSATQLRGIHQACVVWAAAQPGDEQTGHRPLPNDIGILVIEDYFHPKYALHPNADIEVPDDFRDWPDERQRRWVNLNTSYVLVPGLVDDLDRQRVVAFEKPEVTGSRSLAVAFGDNHVRRYSSAEVAEVRDIIQRSTGHTIEELIEMQNERAGDGGGGE
ncbi:MAG: hypothetical protein WD009_02085 [Phycisphaeraceae bacterium]